MNSTGSTAMTQSGQTIQDIFDSLQDTYGVFQTVSRDLFDDVPLTVLATEFSNDTNFDDLPEFVQEATAQASITLAA
jgi:hypothetical protein